KILFAIDEEDLLSKDGKYVYLNGNSINVLTEGLAEGTQSIQTLENYLADSEADDIVFDLNYKSILKVSGIGGIGTKVSDKHRNVVYFNNELIVISVRYDAIFFGMAGVTNVMIDFSENQDNPKMYILDLSAR